MSYRPLTLPADFPAECKRVIDEGIEPAFADVHAMLRLPLPSAGLRAGCGFAVTQVLLAVVSGASVMLYSHKGKSGKLFCDFLNDHYPWDDEPEREGLAKGDPAAKVLWKEYRNPFAHDLGLSIQNRNGVRRMVTQSHVVKVKRTLNAKKARDTGPNERRVEELEADGARPGWLPPTLIHQSHKRVLCAEALYRGVRRAVLSLCKDRARMDAAAYFISSAEKK
jgi:hypothetical protein